MKMLHLVRRAMTSFRNHPVSAGERQIAESILMPAEFLLWERMQHRDQRHSLEVLKRFDNLIPQANRDERAAALLHDVGKCESSLGWVGRILATLFGARTRSFRVYLQHEEIGLRLLEGAASARTVELLQDPPCDDVARAVRRADDI